MALLDSTLAEAVHEELVRRRAARRDSIHAGGSLHHHRLSGRSDGGTLLDAPRRRIQDHQHEERHGYWRVYQPDSSPEADCLRDYLNARYGHERQRVQLISVAALVTEAIDNLDGQVILTTSIAIGSAAVGAIAGVFR